MTNRWIVVALAAAAMTAAGHGTAVAQPDDVGVDVPITVALADAQSGTCTYSFTPRSNVTMPVLGAAATELGSTRLSGVVNCGTVVNQVSVIDVSPGLTARSTIANVRTTKSCASTTGCTATATQSVAYPAGQPGSVEVRTSVTARGVTLCYVDRWAVVGGVSAAYVSGGFTSCSPLPDTGPTEGNLA